MSQMLFHYKIFELGNEMEAKKCKSIISSFSQFAIEFLKHFLF